MSIYLDNGEYMVSCDDRQLILSKRMIQRNRVTKEEYVTYNNPKYFTRPHWLFLYLLRKKICKSKATTFEGLRDEIVQAEQYVMNISKELDDKWLELTKQINH